MRRFWCVFWLLSAIAASASSQAAEPLLENVIAKEVRFKVKVGAAEYKIITARYEGSIRKATLVAGSPLSLVNPIDTRRFSVSVRGDIVRVISEEGASGNRILPDLRESLNVASYSKDFQNFQILSQNDRTAEIQGFESATDQGVREQLLGGFAGLVDKDIIDLEKEILAKYGALEVRRIDG